jgi:4-amino-4-deoxy-L-arabinose transferase-like glycosyltransferase
VYTPLAVEGRGVMRSERTLWMVAIAALAAHAIFIAFTYSHVIPTSQDHYDARQYRELADSILAGDGFQLVRKGVKGPDLDRTPVYPLFVAIFGAGWERAHVVVLAQHLMVLATAYLTWLWVRVRLGPSLAGVAAFAIVAFDLTTMTYASYLLTETLFTFFLTASFFLWPTAGDSRPTARAALSGAAWGLATLARPITLYLAPVAIVAALVAALRRREAFAHALVAVVVGALVVGSWMARNHAQCGHALLSTIEGENLLYYRAALVGLPPGKGVDQFRKELRVETAEGSYDRADPHQAAMLDEVKKQKAIELMIENPLRLHTPFVLGLPRLLFSPNRSYFYKLLGIDHAEWNLDEIDTQSFTSKVFRVETLYLGASVLYQTIVLVLALAGAAIGIRRREPWVVVPAVALAYLIVISSGLETHARFRVPLVPVLAVLSARALMAASERFGSREARR